MTARPTNLNARRRGLSLLEVLVAMAIFLFAMVAIGRLVIAGADRALEVRYKSEAVQIAQTKMAEVAAGAIALSSQGATSVDEDPDWEWSLDAEQGSVANLWNVTVHVSRPGPSGSVDYCTLTQMILDPAQRGSSFDTVTINGAGSSASGSGSSGGSGGSAGGGAAGGGAAAGGAAAGGAAGARGGARGGAAGGAAGGGAAGGIGGGGGGAGAGGAGASIPGRGR
jgi:type II secretion system protein I